MKKAISMLFLLVALVALTKNVFAQEVMIATNISYSDYTVASVAAAKIGAALFFVSENEILTETLEAINSINPEKIYIIGGPAVVSPEIESELNKSYEIVRIWGMTRYGTSCEVAKYFWPEGSEKAILVWDLPDSRIIDLNISSMILKAAEVASSEQIPLILIPRNYLSMEIEETLKILNVSKVTVYGNVGSKVFEELTALDISYESVSGEPYQIRERIEERIRERLREKRPLIIAAVANWQEGLVARASPHGASILVFSEIEINRTIEKVKELIQTKNISKILVVGKPELAQKIYNTLIEAGINESVPVFWVTGKNEEVCNKIRERVKEELEKIREKYRNRLEQTKEKLNKLKENLKERCEYWYLKANESSESLNTSLAIVRLRLIEELYKNCLEAVERNQTLLALKYLNEIKHETRQLIWEYRNTHRVMIQNEIEGEEEDVALVR
ncbi:MAG: cell wall-binding repeat-containing protein, partial [Candidatus Aenigmatarchaeota archaeon]